MSVFFNHSLSSPRRPRRDDVRPSRVRTEHRRRIEAHQEQKAFKDAFDYLSL
ncbi:hypothetical protein [Photobacterium leiognathi]|uniref:hypothetical protein n=1 Tax=Photobacterium leiognathi TaxID=553611 RepID=UPI002739E44A|nr:hypothetical protein [Photobacterium leiognathi]